MITPWLIIVLAVGVPVAWFASEFQSRRWLRLALGCLAILLSFGIAALVIDEARRRAGLGDRSLDWADLVPLTGIESGRHR